MPCGHDEVDAVEHLDAPVGGAHAASARAAAARSHVVGSVGIVAVPRARRGRRRARPGSAGSRRACRWRGSRRSRARGSWRTPSSRAARRARPAGWPCPSSASSHEQLGEGVGLALVEARRGLVEEQHLRPGGQRPAELDQAGQPVGMASTRSSATGADADEVDAGASTSSWTVDAAVARPAAADLRRGEDVLAGGQRPEHLEALERAGDAAAGPACGPWRR